MEYAGSFSSWIVSGGREFSGGGAELQ